MKKKIIIYSILAILFLTAAIPLTPHQQSPSFGIKPQNPKIGYFTFNLNPGESASDTLIASNTYGKDIELKVLPVDGSTGSTGGINFSFSDTSGVSKWIMMSDSGIVKIKSGNIRRLPFQVTVPPNTKPGEYIAGFLAAINNPEETLKSTETENSINVKVVSQIGIAVVINVPGDPKCEVAIDHIDTKIENGKWNVRVNLLNTGTSHFSGEGEFKLIRSNSSDEIFNYPFKIGYFVTSSSINYPLYFDLPADGNYQASISVADKTNRECTTSKTFPISIGKKDVAQFSAQATEQKQALENSIINATPQQPTTSISRTDQNASGLSPILTLFIGLGIGILIAGISFILIRHKFQIK